jgi:DNA topoisomerase VI subunit B
MAKQYHLFPAQEALAGLRDSGIKNTASAISEIIDNSMDAGAENIEILVFEKGQQSGQRVLDKIDQICIIDDGRGMTEDILAQCLTVGGRDDSDDSEEGHIGKFGYGLPNSSMSQCMRVEVYSWQKKNETLYTYLDYEEVLKTKDQFSKPVEKRKIPDSILKKLKNKVKNSGSIILWYKCDRLDVARGDTLFRHMTGDLCRIFRHRLDTDDSYGKRVNIKYKFNFN